MAEVRRVANEEPTQFDLRKFFNPAMNSVKELIKKRMEVLGSAGRV